MLNNYLKLQTPCITTKQNQRHTSNLESVQVITNKCLSNVGNRIPNRTKSKCSSNFIGLVGTSRTQGCLYETVLFFILVQLDHWWDAGESLPGKACCLCCGKLQNGVLPGHSSVRIATCRRPWACSPLVSVSYFRLGCWGRYIPPSSSWPTLVIWFGFATVLLL